MRDRIRPPKDLEKVLDRLKDDDRIFETKQKGMMFAAALGYSLFKEKVDSSEIESYGEGIKMMYFQKPQDEGFIDALSVAKSNDLKSLDPEMQEERVNLFERCALLGLQEMQKHCYDNRPADPILGILTLIDRMRKSQTADLPGLDTVAEEVGEYF